MLHYSIYNRTVTLPDGSKGIYNLVSGQKLKLQGFVEMLFNSALSAPNTKLAKKLKALGFLVDGDELAKLRLQHFAALSSTNHLALTITPTRGCNFRCPYCFEEHLSGGMSEEVQAKLVEMVEKFLQENRVKVFGVSWFGGEPLLYPKIIEHLSDEFMRLCDKYGTEYSAGIVTNGYLFTQENVDMLEARKVESVQITLDGPKELNDKTRILADGRGSYDVIMNNLRTVRTKMSISIRCNTNKENRAGYKELEQIINDVAKETGNNIKAYAAFMDSDITADKEKLTKESLDYDNYLVEDKSKSFTSLDKLQYRATYCTTQNLSAFVVLDDGSLCKCWTDITIPEHVVANLLTDPNPFLTQMNSEWGQKYLGMDIFNIEECAKCQLLPLCCGGCPSKRLSGNRECFKPLESKLDELIIKAFTEPEPRAE